jgi:mRNA-degrading endonuclease RelE of RelBE toxin-antitoxin system
LIHCRLLSEKLFKAKVDEMGTRLESFPHKRLEGRSECKLRAGDYRVLYEFDIEQGRIYLHYVGHRREIYKRR